MSHRLKAFTLVELLVGIGVIAVLISVLLPVLASARKAAEKTKCLAALHQFGIAFRMYAHENNGTWPVAVHFWAQNGPAGRVRDKRYHDFVSKYLMGATQVTSAGVTYGDFSMNPSGSNAVGNPGYTSIADYANHGEFGTVEDPIWIGTFRNRNSVFWGCPCWNRPGYGGGTYDYGINNGYTMNWFPLAPNDLNGPPDSATDVDPKLTARIVDPGSGGGSIWPGKYYKMSQWTHQSERALLFDGVYNAGQNDKEWCLGKNTTFSVTQGTFTLHPLDSHEILPMCTTYTIPLDWNRHAHAPAGQVRSSDASLNMLFCDGHARTVTAREAYVAIRFR